ncbi:O-antigen ligase family protein [Ramlibacter sp.]|uniref:O-antigen ligase family protein n=1 Tax=Ramlibacter sp. TaxID=1917967 RepID=UPI002BA1B49C|nr:O-antigen ligase family protein [Ramlibacter sp.]HWI82329.1 O-antigen ligase family protein [Ramlibacter sp.]
MTRSRSAAEPQGFLHWMLPAMLGLVAITVLLSGRDLSQMFKDLAVGGGMYLHPAVAWLQRGVSLLLVLVAAERLVNHFAMHKQLPSPLLVWTFIGYWLATVAGPAFFGSHPQLSHEYLYTLLIGLAGALAAGADRDRVVDAARNALFLFLLAGAALAVVNPAMVIDTTYNQGLFAGVPRFGGLATHPVALGMFAQTFLLCLWARPFGRRWLTALAWILGLATLFFAQSKTSWIAFIVCSLAMLAVRHGGNVWRRMGDPREGEFGIVACLAVIVLAAGALALVLFADVGSEAAGFLDTTEGAQLMSMTGRDQIWVIALEEWRANQLFGYGPGLWDDAFRASIHLPNATNAHNQFMDTLARSGSIGAAALVVYSAVLLVLALRYAKQTGGLSIALLVSVALRSISEVPLLMFGYGTELFTHLLLLITLASAAAERVHAPVAAVRRTNYRVAS